MAPRGESGDEGAADKSDQAEQAENDHSFPEGFEWGVAATGYALEAGPDDSLESSYFAAEQDIALLRRLGLRHYHVTLSWLRIQPSGCSPANASALEFYCSMVERLVRHGIEPVVALYHWGLPLPLQDDLGGWESPAIISCFANYAREVFRALSLRGVKRFITLQEPWCTAMLWSGHETATAYRIAHHMLLAHAAAARVFRKELHLDAQGCELGVVLNADLAVPAPVPMPDSEMWPGEGQTVVEELSRQAAELVQASSLGWFAGPLFAGDYPDSLRAFSGLAELPVAIGPEEKALLLDSADFLVVRHRAAECVQASVPADAKEPHGGWAAAAQRAETGAAVWRQATVTLFQDPDWPLSDAGEAVLPWALREVLRWIQDRYRPKGGLYVLGPSVGLRERSVTRAMEDTERIQFMRDYLAEMQRAIQDGANVRGYFAGSLADEPDLPDGEGLRSGLARVDARSRRRTPKASARWLACVAASNALPPTIGSSPSMPSRQSRPGRGRDPVWWVAEKSKADDTKQSEDGAGALSEDVLSALLSKDPQSVLCTLEAVDAHWRACGAQIPSAQPGGPPDDAKLVQRGLEQAGLDELSGQVAAEVHKVQPARTVVSVPEALQRAASCKADQLAGLLGEVGDDEQRALASFSPAVLAAASLMLQEDRERAAARGGRRRKQMEAPRAEAGHGSAASGTASLWWLGGKAVGADKGGRVIEEMSPAGEALLATMRGSAPSSEETAAALTGLNADTVQAVLEAVTAHLQRGAPQPKDGDGGELPLSATTEGGSPIDIMLQVVEQVKCAQDSIDPVALARECNVPEFVSFDDPNYHGPYSGTATAASGRWRLAASEAEAWKQKQLDLLEDITNMAPTPGIEAASIDPTAFVATGAGHIATTTAAVLAMVNGSQAAVTSSAVDAAEVARRDREALALLVGA